MKQTKPNAKPIIFSGPMVRALLEGRKTQERRMIKPPPPHDSSLIECGPYRPTLVDRHGEACPGDAVYGAFSYDGIWGMPCPYGQPGDLLWVRECWSHSVPLPQRAWYWADGNPEDGDWTRPKPSIHMPRWASRLTLRITGVRVQRLQEISEEDAMDEGASNQNRMRNERYGVRWFRREWESINGPGSWDSNPWVWALSFEAISKNVDDILEGR